MLKLLFKSTILAAAFVLYISLPAGAASLEILSPSGGETWVGGTEQTIVYKTANSTGIVRLYYRYSASGDWIKIGDVKANGSQYIWKVPGAGYDTKVAQLRALWVESDWSTATILGERTTKAFTVIQPVINPGKNVQAKGVSDSQINVTWTDTSSHEDGFAIYRKKSNTTDFEKIGTVGANVTVFTDTNLAAGTAYHYSVRAFLGSKESAASNIAGSQTLTAGSSPGKTLLIFKLDSKEYYVNGERRAMSVPLSMYKGRMVLPIKYVIDPLYGNAIWDSGKKQVTATLGSSTVICWVGNNKANVNGQMKTIDGGVTPIILGGRLMLPARFVGESLGCTVSYNGTTKEMRITGP